MNIFKHTAAARAFQVEPAFLQRVDDLLRCREELTPMLAALVAELPSGRYRRELLQLNGHFQEGVTAPELCRSRKTVATLMPLLAAEGLPAAAGRGLNEVLGESIREDERRRQRRRVLAYPFVVLLLSLAVLVFLCLAVVPVFHEIFFDFDLDLPAPTTVLLTLSKDIRFRPGLLLMRVGGAAVAVYLVWRLIRWSGLLGSVFDFLASGSSRELSTMALFTRRLADGISARLPLPVALRMAGEITSCRRLRQAAQRLAADAAGDATAVANSSAATRFPATLVHLLDCHRSALLRGAPKTDPRANESADKELRTAAETTARALNALADALSERVDGRFDWSTGIVTQASLLAVGLLVAAVLLALLMPLVRLVTSLSS